MPQGQKGRSAAWKPSCLSLIFKIQHGSAKANPDQAMRARAVSPGGIQFHAWARLGGVCVCVSVSVCVCGLGL